MNCKKCGSPLNVGSRFCINCGVQLEQPQPIQENNSGSVIKQRKKISKVTLLMSCISAILVIVLVVVLFLLPGKNIGGVKVANKSFSTPEEVLEYFVDGVRDCDLNKMSACFALQKTSKKFEFNAYSKRIKAILPATSLMTNDYEQYVSLNEVQRLNQCAAMYKQILYGINDIDLSKTIVLKGENVDDDIKDFVDKINPDSLKNIKISEFRDFSKAKDETHLKNMKSSAETYGADEMKLYEVELECDGNKVFCETLYIYRYDSSWYINFGAFQIGGL